MDYKQKYLKYKEKYLEIKKLNGLIGGAAATETFDLHQAALNAAQIPPISEYKSLDPMLVDNVYNLKYLVNVYTDNNPSLESFEMCKQALIDANGDVDKARKNLMEKKELLEREIKQEEEELELLKKEIDDMEFKIYQLGISSGKLDKRDQTNNQLLKDLDEQLDESRKKKIELKIKYDQLQNKKKIREEPIRKILLDNFMTYIFIDEFIKYMLKLNKKPPVEYYLKVYGDKRELINGIKHNDFWYKTTDEMNDRASSTIILYGSKNNTNWIELKNVTVLN